MREHQPRPPASIPDTRPPDSWEALGRRARRGQMARQAWGGLELADDTCPSWGGVSLADDRPSRGSVSVAR